MPRKRVWMDWEDARKFAQGLNLSSSTQWQRWWRDVDDPPIPLHPQNHYREWTSWPDFLGYLPKRKPRKRRWRAWDDALEFARSLGFTKSAEWKAWAKTDSKPEDIPRCPSETYSKHWQGWPHWMGVTTVPMLPWEEARAVARTLDIRSGAEWRRRWRDGDLPDGLPCGPNKTFSDEWKGWPDFLGAERPSFDDARAYARSLGLRSSAEWKRAFEKRRIKKGLPKCPDKVYAEWCGWGDFLRG